MCVRVCVSEGECMWVCVRAPANSHPKLLISGVGAPDVHSVGYYGRASLGTWGVSRGVNRWLVCVKVYPFLV